MATVSSRLPSSTKMIWSTNPCSCTSAYVLRSVLPALYAGITTTTFLCRNITPLREPILPQVCPKFSPVRSLKLGRQLPEKHIQLRCPFKQGWQLSLQDECPSTVSR